MKSYFISFVIMEMQNKMKMRHYLQPKSRTWEEANGGDNVEQQE
jgi:hypothetical protein